jgi:hypothetical protein
LASWKTTADNTYWKMMSKTVQAKQTFLFVKPMIESKSEGNQSIEKNTFVTELVTLTNVYPVEHPLLAIN